MIKPGQILLLILILSVVFVACEQERDPCLQPRTVSTRILFQKALESDTGVIVSDSALPNAIVGVPDSPGRLIIGQTGKRLTLLPIVLSPHADSTRIYIIPDSAKTGPFDVDTVTFYYQRRLAFISTACGYTYHYFLNGLRTTNNNIDSAIITTPDVNDNVNIRHVKIYY
ncbi:DUF6452 family protein [Polluticoccus soli]|uniref:DUF6452 family protein n=1 Tax=Polluticoccus soli TaxID=3034150 RepID=UPI0023E2D68B|nr:DUF6452 family protein [Flavipsychrobacter sp. JY13-12]